MRELEADVGPRRCDITLTGASLRLPQRGEHLAPLRVDDVAASLESDARRHLDYRVAVMAETALAAACTPESLVLPRFAVPLTAFEVVRVVVPAATALIVPDR